MSGSLSAHESQTHAGDLYVFDFDRTLISTGLVLGAVREVMPDAMRQESDKLHAVGTTVDMVELAEQHGLDPEVLAIGLGQAALYEDVKPWMAARMGDPGRRMLVMTSGGYTWQRIKLDAAGETIPAQQIIIPEKANKGGILAAELEIGEQGVMWPQVLGTTVFRSFTLVDDKLSCLQPLVGLANERVRLFHMLRPDSKEIDSPGQEPVVPIRGLDEIPDLLVQDSSRYDHRS